ncbi:MAG: hypothetical protein J0G94_17675 [Sphingomonadales bacterium]|nr:hypothetical protein [Sphingomonadales bacterium]
MRISIRHETRYEYGEPAAGVIMRLRLMPASNRAQTIESWSVSVNDQPIERWTTNGYGDAEALWRAGSRIEAVTIVAQGVATTYDCAGVLPPGDGEPRPPMCPCSCAQRRSPRSTRRWPSWASARKAPRVRLPPSMR